MKSNIELAYEVLRGVWGADDERRFSLEAAGYIYEDVQAQVNAILEECYTDAKTNTDVAVEVIAGKWGVNEERKKALEDAGYNYSDVQNVVNSILNLEKEAEVDTMPEEKKGISAYVIAAMCGCWKRESGVNPGIWESLIETSWDHEYQYDNIGGFGLGQWTNVGTPRGRCYNLHEWVTANGYEDGDGNGQLAYLPVENYWSAANSVMGNGTLEDFLYSTSTDLDLLVEEFLACWEGVPGDAYAERLEAANEFLDYIEANADKPENTWSWTSGNFYLGFLSDEQLTNVMCVYWFYQGYVPDGGRTKKSKMPLWMKIKYKF